MRVHWLLLLLASSLLPLLAGFAVRAPRRTTVRMAADQLSVVQRGLLAAASTPFAAHEAELPPPTRRLVSAKARMVFGFVLEYLADAELDADVFASGGYVRDLLLGRVSDDLDLSLCLVRCAPGVTIATIAAGLPEFARRAAPRSASSRPSRVRSRRRPRPSRWTRARVRITPPANDGGAATGADATGAIVVDLLPTCGAETYDAHDRVPVRDPRGSAEADSLRRDLTAARCSSRSRARTPTAARASALARRARLAARRVRRSLTRRLAAANGGARAAAPAARRARLGVSEALPVERSRRRARRAALRLLDYHGGVEDIATRVLRCPVPRDAHDAPVGALGRGRRDGGRRRRSRSRPRAARAGRR